jgi:hypothetical protein
MKKKQKETMYMYEVKTVACFEFSMDSNDLDYIYIGRDYLHRPANERD